MIKGRENRKHKKKLGNERNDKENKEREREMDERRNKKSKRGREIAIILRFFLRSFKLPFFKD